MIGNKLLALASAMSEFEGWHCVDPKTKNEKKQSVAYRNHNPGNLRWSPFMLGKKDGFALFVNDNMGKFAMLWDIFKKSKGETSTGLNGESTIKDLIHVWTADSADIKEKYVKHVISRTGFSENTKLKELLG